MKKEINCPNCGQKWEKEIDPGFDSGVIWCPGCSDAMEFEKIRTCDDPFWDGCKEPAEWTRERRWNHLPDAPMALCLGCFDALAERSEDNEFEGGDEWMIIKA